MAVIRRFMLGNTRVTVCDDYAAKTEEEKKRRLKSYADTFLDIYLRGGFGDRPKEYFETHDNDLLNEIMKEFKELPIDDVDTT